MSLYPVNRKHDNKSIVYAILVCKVETSTGMESNTIDVKIPENYKGNPVRVIVDKERVNVDTPPNFISFNIGEVFDTVVVDKKSVPLKDFYEMLRTRGGLSDRIPLVVRLGKETTISYFDRSPPCNGRSKQAWPFKWNGVECSLAGDICIRVHHVSLDNALKVIEDIACEALKLVKDTCTPELIKIYFTSQRIDSSYAWFEHSMRTKRDIQTIYIDQKIKDDIRLRLETFLLSGDLYDRYGINWKRIILLNGPPGTGKTSTVLAIASLMNRSLAKMSITADMTSNQVELLFKGLPNQSFLLLEDVDALFDKNREGVSTRVSFSTIINLMDGVTTPRGMVLFMTTNHLERLDEAFIRRGRIDQVVQFNHPGVHEWRWALESLGSKWPHEHEAYIEQLMQREKQDDRSIACIQEHLFDCLIEERESIL